MAKKIGIWMDYSRANLIDIGADPIETKTIESSFSHEVKQEALAKGETLMNNKEQQQLVRYYNELGTEISNYDEVLLFGPTNAKSELRNVLREDKQYENIHIEVKQADKMTDNQQHAFVKDHFTG